MFKRSSEAPFLRIIGKFKIGLNLKRSYKKLKAVYTSSLHGLIHISQSYFQAIIYLDLGFFCTSYTRSKKVMHVSSFVDTVNFTIFQKVIASRVYIYIYKRL